MMRRNGPCLGVLVLALWPAGAGAQAVQSFDQLHGIVKVGKVVVVTDETGRETTGKVAEVAPSSLVILTRGRMRDADGREFEGGWTGRRLFDAPTIRMIEHRDSLRNGTLVGLAIGLGLAWSFDFTYCSSVGGHCPALYLAFGGIGAAAGMGIDASIRGKQVLYRSPSQMKGVTLSPVVSRDRKGMLALIRF